MRYIKLAGGEWEMHLSVREYVNDDLGEVSFVLRTPEGDEFEFVGGTCRRYESGTKPSRRANCVADGLFNPPKHLKYPTGDEIHDWQPERGRR